MSLHRFLACLVMACWLALTAVMVGTALQWSAARGNSEVKIQRALNAQKEASASGAIQRTSKNELEDPQLAAELQRNHDRLVSQAADASEEMSEAISFEVIERKQFWPEFAVWGGLTLLGSALLAERRDGEERSIAHK